MKNGAILIPKLVMIVMCAKNIITFNYSITEKK